MRSFYCLAIFMLFVAFDSIAQKNATNSYFEIRTYHLANAYQENTTDAFLKDAFLPAIHRAGIKRAGIFKPIDNDTSSDRRIIVLIPYEDFNRFEKISAKMETDQQYQTAGAKYFNSSYDQPPYLRIEKTFLKSFAVAESFEASTLKSPKSERIYELRSYEGPTEKLHASKLKMFLDGDEIGLFRRLGCNAIFYGEVLLGKSMPNLMYMTSFENKESRDDHWKDFFADPQWKKISAMPEYQHNVSHADVWLMHATEYSDL